MVKKLLYIFLICAAISALPVFAENTGNGNGDFDSQSTPPEISDGMNVSPDRQQEETPAPTDGFRFSPDGGNNQQNFPTSENGTGSQGKRENGPGQNGGFSPEGFGQQGGFDRGGFQPGGFFGEQGGMPGSQATDTAVQQTKGIKDYLKEYSTAITAMILLAFAFIFVIFYKRKRY